MPTTAEYDVGDPEKPHEAVIGEYGENDNTVDRVSKVDAMSSPMHGNKYLSPLAPKQVECDALAGWIDGATIETTRDSPDDKNPQELAGFAWSLYHHALELFSLLLPPLLAQIASSTPTYDKRGEKSFKKSLGKLFLWGDGFQGGKLESVLEESEGLKETVVESLTAIGKILLFKLAPQCLAHSNKSEDQRIKQETHDLSILVEKARIVTERDYESDESSTSADAEAEDYFGIANSLQAYVGCLMELLPSMEETLSSLEWHEVDDQKSQPIDFQISGPAQPYVLQVYDKFPLADLHLMHRLGEANWQRHISLRAMENQTASDELFQDLPKVTFVAVSEFHDSGLGSSLPARSTYANIIASHSSFQTAADDKSSGRLLVPPAPKQVSEGKPFNCQICGRLLFNIKNRVDWRRHVFADLKPYLCTFPGCKDELKMFPTRKLWEEHEFGQHRLNRYWNCTTCHHKATSPEDWHTHLAQAHDFSLTEDQYSIAARSAEVREPIPIESISCPLCLEVPGKSQRYFATHVGKHMEGIALAALPRDGESTDTESIASNMSGAGDIPRIPTTSLETQSQNNQQSGRPKYHPSQGDATLVSFMASGQYSDIAHDAQHDPLPEDITTTTTKDNYPRLSDPATVEFLSSCKQNRPHERPFYKIGSFVDVEDQVKNFVQQIQTTKEKEAQGESVTLETDPSADNYKMRLEGGLTKNGKPAKLVRVKKNGKETSIAADLEVECSDSEPDELATRRLQRSISSSKEAEDDEANLKPMARRKRSGAAAEPTSNIQSVQYMQHLQQRVDQALKQRCSISARQQFERSLEARKKYGRPTEKQTDGHHTNHVGVLFECLYRPCPYKSTRESNCKLHMEMAHSRGFVRLKSKKE